MLSRRSFLQSSAAAAGISSIPTSLFARTNKLVVQDTHLLHAHSASVVLGTALGTVYIDPAGGPEQFKGLPPADLVLVTHHHEDHLDNKTLAGVMGEETALISNGTASDRMPAELASRALVIRNGDLASVGNMFVEAVPAYNLSQERRKFHPKGRDNGYVVTSGNTRIYLSSDTENIPEMSDLYDIDLAFVSMSLPYSMDIQAAADAVNDFQPSVVCPYLYRGKDGGTQDPNEFAKMLVDGIKAEQGDWYGAGPGLA